MTEIDESSTAIQEVSKPRGFPARVVTSPDPYTVVINRGSSDGVRVGHRFVIYGEGDEMIDPETGENLGILELVKGTGRAYHVQDRVTTIRSDQTAGEIIRRKPLPRYPAALSALINPFSQPTEEYEIVQEPGKILQFEKVQVGDKARRV